MLLVTAAQMQELDQRTIKEFSIPGLILMENAGRGIFELICRHFAARSHQGVTILVGPGLCLMGYPISPLSSVGPAKGPADLFLNEPDRIE